MQICDYANVHCIDPCTVCYVYRCGNVAAIMELDKDLNSSFKIFNAAPYEVRGVPEKKPPPEYFL